MKTFIVIYFIIGFIVSIIVAIINCKMIKKLRKSRYKQRLEIQEKIKDENLRMCFLGIYELRPWYIDYFMIPFCMIFDTCLWPVDLILIIKRKYIIKYTYGFNGYFEKYKE